MKRSFELQPLLLELLAWVSRKPRSYRETMDAWRTNCPRFSVWEDAWLGHLLSVEVCEDGSNEQRVKLTPLGKALLEESTKAKSTARRTDEGKQDRDFTRNLS